MVYFAQRRFVGLCTTVTGIVLSKAGKASKRTVVSTIEHSLLLSETFMRVQCT